MLALFSLRLAFGLIACLPLLPARLVHPRFYRTHLLTALALGFIAIGVGAGLHDLVLLACLVAVIVLALGGSMLWRLEGAPGGQWVILLTLLALGASIWRME